MSDRLKCFSLDELHSLVFRLEIAQTIEPLDEVAERLRAPKGQVSPITLR
jgi:hypothetical protein